MRRVAPLFALPLLVLALAACGGGKNSAATSPTATAPPADPGRQTVEALVAAAKRSDAQAMWSVLSAPSRKRLGPTLAAFKQKSMRSVETALAPFEAGNVAYVMSRQTGPANGLAVIVSGSKGLALPLRHERSGWKVEAPGPIKIDITDPRPASSGRVGKVVVELHRIHGAGQAGLFVDGRATAAKVVSRKGSATVYANLGRPLSPGLHVATAYAQFGDNVSAVAWTFTATKQ